MMYDEGPAACSVLRMTTDTFSPETVSPETVPPDAESSEAVSTQAESSEAVELVTCTSWCESGDGHPNQFAREDQSCLGVQHQVTLSTEPTQHLAGGSTRPAYATTYLTQQPDQQVPRVFIGNNEDDGASATLEEARRFALEILTLVDGQRNLNN
jgi:hypothetical protein